MSLMSMGITAGDVKNALDRVKGGRFGTNDTPSRSTYILCPVDQTLWDLKPVVSIIDGFAPRDGWVTQTYEKDLLKFGFWVIKFDDLKSRKLGIRRVGDAELDAELDEDHTLLRPPDGAEIKNGHRRGKAANVLSRENELAKAYQIIAAGVRNSTQSEEDRAVKRVLEAKSLADGCDIEALLKRLGKEQLHRCAITSIPFDPEGHCKPSPDRIDSSNREYSDENIQLFCKWINFAKNNMLDAEFRDLMQRAAISMSEPDLKLVE